MWAIPSRYASSIRSLASRMLRLRSRCSRRRSAGPLQRNPHKRPTVPEDVARCITALCHPATYWMTGNTLHVDGGENVVG